MLNDNLSFKAFKTFRPSNLSLLYGSTESFDFIPRKDIKIMAYDSLTIAPLGMAIDRPMVTCSLGIDNVWTMQWA